MNLQQLRYVLKATQHHLNLTNVASEVFASQSSVSKQIRELETELGFSIFLRKGKRLIGLTESGKRVISLIEQAVLASDNVKRFAEEWRSDDSGRLVVAMASNLAIHLLPPVIRRFRELYPQVSIELRQADAKTISQMIAEGTADIGLSSDDSYHPPEMIAFPAFTWQYVPIVARDHILARAEKPTLAEIAKFPLITYDPKSSCGQWVQRGFRNADLNLDMQMIATDSAIIKEYVKLGSCIGVICEIAISNNDRDSLRVLRSPLTFERRTTKVVVRRNKLLQAFAYRFIETLAPHLPQKKLEQAVRQGQPYNPASLPAWPIDLVETSLANAARPQANERNIPAATSSIVRAI